MGEGGMRHAEQIIAQPAEQQEEHADEEPQGVHRPGIDLEQLGEFGGVAVRQNDNTPTA